MWRFVPRSLAVLLIGLGLPVNSLLAQAALDPRTSWLAAAAEFDARGRTLSDSRAFVDASTMIQAAAVTRSMVRWSARCSGW